VAEHHENVRGGAWYRTYVVTWFWLLVITVLEIATVFLGLPRLAVILLLVTLALMKAALIAAYFMHLRHERLNLIFTIAAPLILIVILFLGVARDALNVFFLRQ